jgi:hypothetical protein
MTSATMVFGMLPLTFKLESGAESRAPMAVVVIGAIAMSTVLAIIVIPAVYTLLDDLALAFARWRAPKPVVAAEPVGTSITAPAPVAAPAPAVVHVQEPGPHAPIRGADGLREGIMPIVLQDGDPTDHGRLS